MAEGAGHDVSVIEKRFCGMSDRRWACFRPMAQHMNGIVWTSRDFFNQ